MGWDLGPDEASPLVYLCQSSYVLSHGNVADYLSTMQFTATMV